MVTANEQTRNAALERHKEATGSAGSYHEKVSIERGTPNKKTPEFNGDRSEVNEVLLESVKRRRDMEERKLSLSEARLKFDQERTSRDEGRFNRSHYVLGKRITPDEIRFELKRDDKREGRRERDIMMEIMKEMLTTLKLSPRSGSRGAKYAYSGSAKINLLQNISPMKNLSKIEVFLAIS